MHKSGDEAEAEARSVASSDSDQFISSSEESDSQISSYVGTPVSYVDRSLCPWTLDENQSRGFQFFHLQTVPSLRLFNHSADTFYGRCIPAMAATDDLIRRMTITVGLFHLECVRSRPVESMSALKEYGYSLRQLSRSNDRDRIAVLAACALFVSMEMLRGRFHQAMIHVQRGMNILATTDCDGSKYRSADPLSSLELYHLRVIFSQVAEAAGLLNFMRDGTQASKEPELPNLEKDIEDYAEARRGARSIARYCMNVGVDTEHTANIWQRWHIKTNRIMDRLLTTSRDGVLDVPLLL